ncbi:MAG: hypothetical protein PVH91_00715 [Pseudomonadales bacterium]|jgi:hypothetical protein
MKLRKTLLAMVVLLVGTTAGAASTVSVVAPEKEMEGTIQSLDFAGNTMIFQGVRFRMAPELIVQIRGGTGAFTMLKEGMKALVTYRVLSASDREATRIEQLPDNQRIDGT